MRSGWPSDDVTCSAPSDSAKADGIAPAMTSANVNAEPVPDIGRANTIRCVNRDSPQSRYISIF